MDRSWRVLAAQLTMCVAVGGCATYAPAPLASGGDTTWAQPDMGAIAVAASRLDHPRLKPTTIDLGQALTPDELGLIAVVANPDLKAARAKAKVAEAQAFDAGLLPDPVLNFNFDQRLSGPDPFNGWGAQIVYELTALRDHAATLAAAHASRDQVRLDLAWQEWQTYGQRSARLSGGARHRAGENRGAQPAGPNER